MPVHSCLYQVSNSNEWKEKARAESTRQKHAEKELLDHVRLSSQVLLFIQNAAPCTERCEEMLTQASRSSTTGKGNRAQTIPGHSIIVKIIGDHGGYVDATGNIQYYHNGKKSNARPEAFPPTPANFPADPVFGK